jgi:hypothetical protein
MPENRDADNAGIGNYNYESFEALRYMPWLTARLGLPHKQFDEQAAVDPAFDRRLRRQNGKNAFDEDPAAVLVALLMTEVRTALFRSNPHQI